MLPTVGVDKIIRIVLSSEGPMGPYIHKTLSWYKTEWESSRSFETPPGHTWLEMVTETEYSTIFHGIPCSSMFFHVLPCSSMFFHDLPWPSIAFYEVLPSVPTPDTLLIPFLSWYHWHAFRLLLSPGGKFIYKSSYWSISIGRAYSSSKSASSVLDEKGFSSHVIIPVIKYFTTYRHSVSSLPWNEVASTPLSIIVMAAWIKSCYRGYARLSPKHHNEKATPLIMFRLHRATWE